MSDQNIQLNKLENTYLYKKTEKLVSALYLLSNFLSDKEPIKWELRRTGLDLILKDLSVNQINQVVSVLQVAYTASLFSEMNFNILKFEFEGLIQKVEQEEREKLKGHILSESFFNVPALPVVSEQNFSKGHNTLSDSFTRPIVNLSVKTNEAKQKDKSNRQEIIINLLKKNSELSIKDFVMAIKGCSEKTIQRELASLVSKGQIKKEGEKRWSRYSIK